MRRTFEICAEKEQNNKRKIEMGSLTGRFIGHNSLLGYREYLNPKAIVSNLIEIDMPLTVERIDRTG